MAQTAPASRGASADQLRARDAAVVSPAYARYSDLVVESASGPWLHTVDGRQVLDMGCGIGVTNLGHNHPAVVAAVHVQVDKLWHTSVTALHPTMIEACEALVRVAPTGLDSVFLCNSGAEAVEGAIKLARKATGRSEIIAFEGAFHGRSYGALTLTASRARYHAGVGPLLPGVHHVPYPTTDSSAESLMGLSRLLAFRVDAADVAAIVVEPILGEGGYVIPPDDFLPALRRVCDENGILLVVDEVQSGVARSGRFFAVEHSRVSPDILTFAKGIGNGLPIGGLLARSAVMAAFEPGDHGTTYGGNAVACAAVVAVIETVERERLAERAARLGDQLVATLDAWRAWAPCIAEVRGRGLMIGIELRSPDGSPDAALVRRLRAAALRRDLLLLSCGTADNVIRLVPPLTIDEADLAIALERLEASLREVMA